MPRKKETAGQYSMDDYRLKQVDIRLKLMEGPSYYSQTPLTSPEGAAAVMRDVLKELDREWVCVVNMDNHLKPVNFNIVSIGSINQSLAPIQNILKSGILSNCNNIMLMHNHPSGDNEPSREDIQLTKRLVEAAKLMDMNVVDHVVIGGQNGNVYSMREHDPDMFTSKDIDLDYIHRMMTKEPAPEPENKKNMSAPEIRETSAVEPDQWQKETIPPVDSDYKLVSYGGERIDENYIDGLTHSDGKPKETDVSVSGTEPSQEVLDRRIKSTERLLQMNNLPEDVKNELQETLTAYQDARAVDDQGVFPMPVRFRTGEESLPMLDILAQGIFRESALCFAEMAKDPDVGSPAIIQADKVLRADFCSGKLTSPKILENNENRKYQFHSQPEREPVSTDRENR